MPALYHRPGLTLSQDRGNDPAQVRALQRDLRALGYLRSGIDGTFGSGTMRAVRSLQYDLMFNSGASRGGDGAAPVAMMSYNAGAGGKIVAAIDGIVSETLAGCIEAIIADQRVPKLPNAADPVAQNRAALAAILNAANTTAPAPFIAAIVLQESNGQHYNVPRGADEDSFVTVGLDRNNRGDDDQITSRGYGIGQYTLFHHPPRPEEVADSIIDPVKNVQKAFADLHDKFAHFVIGPGSMADDRIAEHGAGALRLCKYLATDPRYMRDCAACAAAAPKIEIARGTPVYAGADLTYQPDQYYASASYRDVPGRADFACDWPYAVRRYNGTGNDSYHYQTKVLLNLLGLGAASKP